MAKATVAKRWLDDDGAFLFGKYKGTNVEEVAQDDPGYLSWLVNDVEDCDDSDREVVEMAIRWRSRR